MLISLEGSIGAGKTTLVEYLAAELGVAKTLENHELNPFLRSFYEGADVQLETELTFLLIHYSQLKRARKNPSGVVLADFSLEKDQVFARMNLSTRQVSLFEQIYAFVSEEIGIPELVIYLECSPEVSLRRISQRRRHYELDATPEYFSEFNRHVRDYFSTEHPGRVVFVDTDDLEMHPDDPKVRQIRELVVSATKAEPGIHCYATPNRRSTSR